MHPTSTRVWNWKAIRLVLAHEHKRVKVQYGGNFSGGVDETGGSCMVVPGAPVARQDFYRRLTYCLGLQ